MTEVVRQNFFFPLLLPAFDSRVRATSECKKIPSSTRKGKGPMVLRKYSLSAVCSTCVSGIWVINTLCARSLSRMKNGHKLVASAELDGPLV